SVREALVHAAAYHNLKLELDWVSAEELEQGNVAERLGKAQGILVPGGFGERGIEGKVAAARFAREHRVPYLGLCLGVQVMVIEFARHVLRDESVNSSEFAPGCPHPVVDLMEEQRGVTNKGGTMRLGNYPCVLVEGTKARAAYGVERVVERHRHRYEFNEHYRAALEAAGLTFSGMSADNSLVEMIELKDHPWFLACQFHPEFTSTPRDGHPLFKAFVEAALKHKGAGA
ncbi:MAG: CTP synthase, partial [Halothiobacillaceae bacterium]